MDPLEKVTASDARNGFSELISSVKYGKRRVCITSNGKDMAAMVPLQDLDAAGRGPVEAEDQPGEQGLARAIGAADQEPGAVRQLQTQVLEGQASGYMLEDPLQLQRPGYPDPPGGSHLKPAPG